VIRAMLSSLNVPLRKHKKEYLL